MKKTSLIALLTAGLLLFSGCAASFQKVNPNKYLTLGQYKGLTYTKKTVTVSDYDQTLALYEKLAAKNYYEDITPDDPIMEGVVRIGDTLNIDYKGTKQGVAFEGGTATAQSLTIGSGSFIDGFEEKLVGVAVGDTVKLDLTFPISYGTAELAGQDVVFEVKVNYISSRREYTPLTEEIAKDLGADSVAALKENIKQETLAAKEQAALEDEKDNLWNEVIKNTTFRNNIPSSLLKIYQDRYEAMMKTTASQNGYTSIEDAIAAGAITQEKYIQGRDSFATSQAQVTLISWAIAKAEGYEITEEIFAAKTALYAQENGFQNTSPYLKSLGENGEELMRNQIVMEFAIDTVVKNAIAK
jgi:trigger factor